MGAHKNWRIILKLASQRPGKIIKRAEIKYFKRRTSPKATENQNIVKIQRLNE